MYDRDMYVFPNAIEVEERHSYRHGAPGQSRQKSRKPTPEAMERVNQWIREKKCRHKLRMYFRPNDLYVTLTYRKEERPENMEQAVDHFRKFAGKLRRKYKKAGAVLRWIRNIEVGSRGAWHIHVCITRIEGSELMIAEAWPYGYVDLKFIRVHREYHELAAYMTKTPRTEKRLVETSYSSSRNMPLPEPKKTVLLGSSWRKDPMKKKGFVLDKESYHEGINPVTGYPYRYYTLLRIQKEKSPP